VTWPLAQCRQRPRRRITPNTNTSTTTMISTHNHVDMAASLVGAGAGQVDATAAHLGKQLGHGPATSRAGARAAPAADHAQARWGLRPSGHAPPAQPIVSTGTTREEDSGRRQSTRRDYIELDCRLWRGRESFALLGWGDNVSMAVLRRDGRRRAAGAGPMVRAFGETRTCAEDGCTAQLSRYNPARCCAIDQGWDRQGVTRPRRPRPELPATAGRSTRHLARLPASASRATVMADCPGG
jgi:hypothetical protein